MMGRFWCGTGAPPSTVLRTAQGQFVREAAALVCRELMEAEILTRVTRFDDASGWSGCARSWRDIRVGAGVRSNAGTTDDPDLDEHYD